MQEALESNAPSGPLGSAEAYRHYLEGNLQADRGDHAAAVNAYREALALDGSATHVRLRLALEYWRLGQSEEAETEARETVADDPRSAEAREVLGTFYLQESRPQAGAKQLEQAIGLDPKRTDAYRALVQARLALGDERGAERVLDVWATANPGDGLGWREFGELQLSRGDLARAERFLKRALKFRPEDPPALAALGRLADQRGRADQAMAFFQRSLRADPEDPAVLFALGQHHLRKAALVRDGVSELAAGRGCFNSLIAMATDEATARVQVAFAYLKGHQDSEALRELDRATAADPQSARVRYLRGEVELQLGHLGEAVSDLGSVPPGDDGYAEARGKLGLALFKLHRIDEAIAALHAGLTARPESAELTTELAEILRVTGDFEGAVATMRELLKFEPHNAEALNFIGYEYAERGIHLPEAEKLVTEALAVQPSNGVFADSLGWVYFRRGKLRQAIETLQRARRFAPDEAAIAEHLGDVYQATGDPALALASYGRALRILDAHPDPELAADLKRKLEGLKARTASTE